MKTLLKTPALVEILLTVSENTAKDIRPPPAAPTLDATMFVRGDIDTDVIIPARYLSTFAAQELAKHAFEDRDPKVHPTKEQSASISPFAVVVTGRNRGCGSSREHAPIALKGAQCKW